MAWKLETQRLGVLEPAHHREQFDEDPVAIQRAILGEQTVQHDVYVELIDRDECSPSIRLVDAHDALEVRALGFASFDLVLVCQVALKFAAIGACAVTSQKWLARWFGLWSVGNGLFMIRFFLLEFYRVDPFLRLLPSLLRSQLLCSMLQASLALFPELVTSVPLSAGIKCLLWVAF